MQIQVYMRHEKRQEFVFLTVMQPRSADERGSLDKEMFNIQVNLKMSNKPSRIIPQSEQLWILSVGCATFSCQML